MRTIFRTHGFAGFAVFSFCVLNYYFENAQRVVGCSFIKTLLIKTWFSLTSINSSPVGGFKFVALSSSTYFL